jgi:hypothetical protein
MASFEGFSENDLAFLHEIAGLHPFFLQLACYILFEKKVERPGSAAGDYDSVHRQFSREARGHFEYMWNRLRDNERSALKLMGDGRVGTITLDDRERLEQKCLIYQGDIFSSAFAEFVKLQHANAYQPNRYSTNFDVFLAYNSQDKPKVKAIAEELKRRGLRPWLDKEQIPPGRWFQDVIQRTIPMVKSAAILIGPGGAGKWRTMELRSFISRCVEEDLPIIPVLLPDVDRVPEELVFLKEFNWVRFSGSIEDLEALDALEWGITGKHPRRNLR